MNKNITIKSFVLVILMLFFSFQSQSFAATYAYADDEVSDGDILAEWLVRPVSIAGTIAGAASFLVFLPFSVTSDSTEESFEKLVKEPFEYSFHRPVGHYRTDREY